VAHSLSSTSDAILVNPLPDQLIIASSALDCQTFDFEQAFGGELNGGWQLDSLSKGDSMTNSS
jgi:hypothetical protein